MKYMIFYISFGVLPPPKEWFGLIHPGLTLLKNIQAVPVSLFFQSKEDLKVIDLAMS